MKNEDVALIERILAGDEDAFASLIRKYQKQVHAQALRKVDDFQIAEDIVQQDLRKIGELCPVYQRIASVLSYKRFLTRARWLIRRCLRKIRNNVN